MKCPRAERTPNGRLTFPLRPTFRSAAVLALATIFMLLCLGYLRFRADMDGPLDSATRQTVARVLKARSADSRPEFFARPCTLCLRRCDVHEVALCMMPSVLRGPARFLQEKDIAWVKTSAPAEGDSVVRGGAASNAERRPLLPKSALPTTDL